MASFLIASLALHAALLPIGNLRPPALVTSAVPITVISAGDADTAMEASPASTAARSPSRAPEMVRNSVAGAAGEPQPTSVTHETIGVTAPLVSAESGIVIDAAESVKPVVAPHTGTTLNSEGGFTHGFADGIGTAASRRTGQGHASNSDGAGGRAETATYVGASYRTTTKPDYPERARREGKEGRVLLQVLVDAEGRSKVVEVDTSSGSEVLDQAARDAIRRWRFSPARQGERAVESWVKIPIEFRLNEARN